MSDVESRRRELVAGLFPEGFPRIWCPPLTHYREDGSIDFDRIGRHIDSLTPHINSFLIPGSTGDGWELTIEEFKQVVDYALNLCRKRDGIRVLIGLLRTELDGMIECMNYVLENNRDEASTWKADCYRCSGFKGFVICPPKGKGLSQDEIRDQMENILNLGYPIVLYQLPQITENEMSPDLVEYFCTKYFNCYMLKDSSGKDRVANADKDYRGLILVRGAEEDYSKMLKESGGRYDGFLLSTGNSFPEQLSMIVKYSVEGRQEEADNLSMRLSNVVREVFNMASSLPSGNAFTNSNKLIDHIRAYGLNWREHGDVRLHSGHTISQEMIAKVEEILKRNDLFPERGYLE